MRALKTPIYARDSRGRPNLRKLQEAAAKRGIKHINLWRVLHKKQEMQYSVSRRSLKISVQIYDFDMRAEKNKLAYISVGLFCSIQINSQVLVPKQK